jgi:hypothetical protein
MMAFVWVPQPEFICETLLEGPVEDEKGDAATAIGCACCCCCCIRGLRVMEDAVAGA